MKPSYVQILPRLQSANLSELGTALDAAKKAAFELLLICGSLTGICVILSVNARAATWTLPLFALLCLVVIYTAQIGWIAYDCAKRISGEMMNR